MGQVSIDAPKVKELVARKNLDMYEFSLSVLGNTVTMFNVLARGTCNYKTAVKISDALGVPLHEIAYDSYIDSRNERIYDGYLKCGQDPAYIRLCAKKLSLSELTVRNIIKKEYEKRKAWKNA